MRILVPAAAAFLSMFGAARAGTIAAMGALEALDGISQMQDVIGSADFDEGPLSGIMP